LVRMMSYNYQLK